MFPKYRVPWHGIRDRSCCRGGGALQGDIYDFYDLQVDYGALSFFKRSPRVCCSVFVLFTSLFVVLCVLMPFFLSLFAGEFCLLGSPWRIDGRSRRMG